MNWIVWRPTAAANSGAHWRSGLSASTSIFCQGLNREANTLGSRVHQHATTQTAVEMKVLIEQIREQVQNLE
ncbi:MAG: DUF1732 domain-containing protein [Gammaproteobacteria bacterium]|nr:DUF1732 domain-containing protein [Gammaproteobacteria bacterium]